MADIPLKQHILSQIWQNSPDNMFLMRPGNDDFYMIDANLAERTSFELISSLANGTPLRNLLPAELYDQVTANYRHCMELRESISYEEAETITRHDGRTTWWSTILSPILDDDGRIAYLFGISRNITRLKEAQKAAETANEVKTAFLANMSHEMRTPLNSVMGAAELLKNTDSAEEREQLCNMILNAAQTLTRQTTDILDYARINSGNLTLESEPFSIVQVCNDVADLLRSNAENKGVGFELDIDDSIPGRLTGDAERLKQILINLVNNAIKFTDSGKVSLHVKLENQLGQDYQLRFAINDTGIGIHEDDLPKLFRPFSQVDHSSTRRYPGTGLGLAICRDLVKAKNGDIRVQSTPGVGSTFEVLLNYPASILPEEEDVRGDIGDSIRTQQLQILLAEDHRTNQMIVCKILGRIGVQVTAVDNGLEALEACKNRRFDAILMDWHMPVMDGLEATRQIRRLNSYYQKLPIIALTASASEGDREQCLDSGMDDVVLKPVNTEKMVRTILRLHLERNRRARIKA